MEEEKKVETPDYKKTKEEIEASARKQMEEYRERAKVALEVIGEGKGRLRLETPIIAGDKEITELIYDFTEMTGLEYTAAMDSDPGAQQIYRITYRQGLALFATAAAKLTANVDTKDIMERMGVTDAVEAVQLSTSFFAASTRAGRMRLSKK